MGPIGGSISRIVFGRRARAQCPDQAQVVVGISTGAWRNCCCAWHQRATRGAAAAAATAARGPASRVALSQRCLRVVVSCPIANLARLTYHSHHDTRAILSRTKSRHADAELALNFPAHRNFKRRRYVGEREDLQALARCTTNPRTRAIDVSERGRGNPILLARVVPTPRFQSTEQRNSSRLF